jgi:elongation factor Ts
MTHTLKTTHPIPSQTRVGLIDCQQPAAQGQIILYSHGGGRIGVMLEINTETQAASQSGLFNHFAHELALHITASAPLYGRDEDIPQSILDELAQEAAEKARRAAKPEKIIPHIVEGVLEKYKNKTVLLRQLYIRDETLSIAQLLEQTARQLGEALVIRRFLRWEICPDTKNE